MSARWLAAVLIAGCSASAPPAPRCPEPAPEPTPVAEPVAESEPAAAPYWPALIAAKPAKAAPPELAQFGRLVGVWRCTGESRQKDGTFKPGKAPSTWTWFYALGGRAVQDIFEPGGGAGAVGTNLRIYDPARNAWEIRWVTGARTDFERITAEVAGDDIVMRGEVSATNPFGAHARKITFFDIGPESFEWKYEATKSGTDTGWTEFSRIHCERTSADPLEQLAR